MSVTSWFTSIQNWVFGWFTDETKQRILALLNGVKGLVDQALPIIKAIDQQLKPFLSQANVDTLKEVTKFLSKYMDDFDTVLALANKLSALPMADMLANIALELLKLKVPTNSSFSTLRLAVELAYSIYKAMSPKAQAKV